jgi:RimJ/RimL family protein N-acetyltransferase
MTTLSHDEALAFTDESQRQLLREHLGRPNTLWLVALAGDRLIGELTLIGGRRAGNAHTVTLGVSVAMDWRGRGVGRALTLHAIEWARHAGGVRRIELDVFGSNTPAIRLYQQLGFVTEGRRRSAYVKNGVEIDGLVMALLL